MPSSKMKRNQSSLTAEGIAMARALESSKPAGERVCYDPYARQFVSTWLWMLGKATMGYATRRSPGVLEFLAARTRYIDDYVASCIADGIEQLVILGAGFDMRAYRIDGLRSRAKVFEVDHPATQRAKIEKMRKILGAVPEQVTFVPIDFGSETLDELFDYGYDRQLKTLFIWEGVTMYIAAGAVDATLAFVARNSSAGSSIIFDYIYKAALDGTMKENEVKSMQRWRGVTGEGLVFGIEKGRIEEFLASRGFAHIVNADADVLRRAYFDGANQNGRVVAPVYAIVHAAVC
jgi:methyltransferase (TIGR00027 family)